MNGRAVPQCGTSQRLVAVPLDREYELSRRFIELAGEINTAMPRYGHSE
jgi:hypothetical protein